MLPVAEVVPFGRLLEADTAGRRDVSLIPLHSSALAVSILTLGATLNTVEAPDRGGRMDHVVLHLPSLLEREDRHRNPYLGATCGRFANRIAGSEFELDGTRVLLAPNEGRHHLHGGPDGFDRRVWDVAELARTDDGGRVVLALDSPHGDQGYPGSLEVTATYELHGHTLRITYTATTDATTVINITNHAYWNLGGVERWSIDRSIGDHELRVPAHRFLPVDEHAIPSGPLDEVHDTPFDLRRTRLLEDVLSGVPAGIDHAYRVSPGDLDGPPPVEELHLAAELHHPVSGRTLTVFTDQSALQVYTANGLGMPFGRQSAVCLETQRFPDAPNRPDLGPAVLHPGEHYCSETELTLGLRW